MENIEENDLAKDRRKPHKKEPKKTKVTRKRDVRGNMTINEDGTIKISNLLLGKPFSDKRVLNYLTLLDSIKRKGGSSLPANIKTIAHMDSYPAGGGFMNYAIAIKEDFKRGKNKDGKGRLLVMNLAVDTKTNQATCYSYKRDYIRPFILSYILCCDTEEEAREDLKLFKDSVKEAEQAIEEKFKVKTVMDLRDWKNTSR